MLGEDANDGVVGGMGRTCGANGLHVASAGGAWTHACHTAVTNARARSTSASGRGHLGARAPRQHIARMHAVSAAVTMIEPRGGRAGQDGDRPAADALHGRPPRFIGGPVGEQTGPHHRRGERHTCDPQRGQQARGHDGGDALGRRGARQEAHSVLPRLVGVGEGYDAACGGADACF
jgi:hypothetical protein